MSTMTHTPSRTVGDSVANTKEPGAPLSRQAGAKAHGAVEYLSDGAHRVVDSIESAASAVEPRGRRVLSGAQAYVQANPLLSIGIAVAAGMVVRHLVRR